MKSPVFPWNKFPGVDTVLGPEMKSTGEVMGVADNFGEAFAKAQLAAGQKLPTQGTVFISVTDHDKPHVADVARKFVDMGFKLVATAGTADVIEAAGMNVERVYKVKEGRPNVVDLIKGDRIQLDRQHTARTRALVRRKSHSPRSRNCTNSDDHDPGCGPGRRRRHRRPATRRSECPRPAASARGTGRESLAPTAKAAGKVMEFLRETLCPLWLCLCADKRRGRTSWMPCVEVN